MKEEQIMCPIFLADLQKISLGVTKQHKKFGTLKCLNLFIEITHSNVRKLVKKICGEKSLKPVSDKNYFLT